MPTLFGTTTAVGTERLKDRVIAGGDLDLDGNKIIGGISVLGAGVLTLHASTTAYAIDYVDFKIEEKELAAGDIIMVELSIDNDSDKLINTPVYITDVTTQVASTAFATPTLKNGFHTCKVMQSQKDTSKVIFQSNEINDVPTHSSLINIDETDDDDIFSKAFTIRIMAKYDALANQDSKIGYVVYITKTRI